MSEKNYKFNSNHLYRLINDSIDLYFEYREKFDKSDEEARSQVFLDTLDGLEAERELFELGEVLNPNQIIEKVGRKKKWSSPQEKNKYYNDKRRGKLDAASNK